MNNLDNSWLNGGSSSVACYVTSVDFVVDFFLNAICVSAVIFLCG